MSLPLIRKPFIVQGLAFTIAVFMMNNAQAASEQEQIQQLTGLKESLHKLDFESDSPKTVVETLSNITKTLQQTECLSNCVVDSPTEVLWVSLLYQNSIDHHAPKGVHYIPFEIEKTNQLLRTDRIHSFIEYANQKKESLYATQQIKTELLINRLNSVISQSSDVIESNLNVIWDVFLLDFI